MAASSIVRRVLCVGAALLLAVGLAAAPAGADGPPGPGPYPKLVFADDGPDFLTCRDADGTLLYADLAWTTEPLVRGPAFAPVVLFLEGAYDAPVMPLDFTVSGFPIIWYRADGSWGGLIEQAYGRPVGYGPRPTDPAPRVRCGWSMLGYADFGTYLITPGLAGILGLPADAIGGRARFDNEAAVQFTVPRHLFPLTARVTRTALPVPDAASHPRRSLPTVTCTDRGKVRYRGPAYTLAVLERGYRWAPMAFWLAGDRIAGPQWFTATVSGTWRTTAGEPARSGTLAVSTAGVPRAYGGPPARPTDAVACRWGGPHRTITTVSPQLAEQLGLPNRVIGRDVELSGSYTTVAYVPRWLFPPA